jgi:D-beta-D-heptose 7-phosphate kinase/D-beta-D-heptose 1-phosphate adenosyltransferase
MPKNVTVIVSGGFDPLHSGHIAYITAAAKLGNRLVVGVNSDAWLMIKKGQAFMPLKERLAVIRALRCVDEAVSFDDTDGTAIKLIEAVQAMYPKDQVVFANGGDRTSENIPEMSVAGASFVFGVGGTAKKNSSSWILEDWRAPRTDKPWGHYVVLHEAPGVKVKELVVEPGKSLSLQRHNYRAEHWHVSAGLAFARVGNGTHMLYKNDTLEIPCGAWHQLANLSKQTLRIVEIQYGERCEEDDIERQPIDLSAKMDSW